jgi:hypothetical protein
MSTISEKHSEAARANGARSRGPKTPEGKAISSKNATRHGLLAKFVVLSSEDVVLFAENVDELIERFQPADGVEMALIEEMAAAHWRLRRNLAIEHAILESGIANQPPGAAFQRVAGVFCDPVSGPVLTLVHRYETRLRNIWQRALRTLTLLRNTPKTASGNNSPVPNEPKTASVCNTEPDPPTPTGAPEPPVDRASPAITPDAPDFAAFPVLVIP